MSVGAAGHRRQGQRTKCQVLSVTGEAKELAVQAQEKINADFDIVSMADER
jgi:hypothetical protein